MRYLSDTKFPGVPERPVKLTIFSGKSISAYSTPVPSAVILRYLSLPPSKLGGVPESPVKLTWFCGKSISAYSIPVPSFVTFRYLSDTKFPGVPERPVKLTILSGKSISAYSIQYRHLLPLDICQIRSFRGFLRDQ